MATDYIPRKFAEFNNWQKQLVKGLLTDPVTEDPVPFPPGPGDPPANWTIWDIPQEKMQELVDAQATYQPFYDKWSDEDARNNKIIEDHQREHDKYEKFIRTFVARWLRNNELLTTGDLAGLGLTVPDTEPTAVTPLDYGPAIKVETIRPGLHIIRASDPENPNSRALPGKNKVELQLFIGAANLQETDLQWSTYKLSGKGLINVEFEAEDKGKTAYYRAFFVTTRGDRSIASTVLEMGIV